MRRSLVIAIGSAIFAGFAVAEAAVPSAPAAALASDVAASRSVEPVCRGCGCRGGPGYRKSNGKCASWGRRR